MKSEQITKKIIFIFLALVGFSSCKKFVEVDPPRTALIKKTVFESDATAKAAILDIYTQLRDGAFAGGSLYSISFLGTLLSDEQINYFQSSPALTAEIQQFNDNTLLANNSTVQRLWADLYKCIYKSNSIIEGLALSTNISAGLKQQLEAEAKFIRAFCHFYLVNLWGDVPLITTTDYSINSGISRAPKSAVYQQIIDDLVSAQNSLAADYSFSNGERVRVNKWGATALLARVYLYVEDWTKAEAQASTIIANTSLFSLKTSLGDVFLTNNTEAILQLWSQLRPNERGIFRFVDVPNYGALRPLYVNNFEPGDNRRATWTSLTSSGYYRTLKYSSATDNPPAQYSTVLRLAEQYLIRAEARAKQGKIIGPNSAESDIDIIRNRAGLGNIAANTQASMLLAIEQERRSELFTEWGHRWFDLKRTDRTGTVLSPIKSQWSATSLLLPIPESELRNNTALIQNPGY